MSREAHDDTKVIVLTGVVSALLVILSGLLIIQAGNYFRSVIDPTSPPVPTAPPAEALALLIAQQGEWWIQVRVESPGEAPKTYENRGLGYLVIPPQYEAPLGSSTRTEITFQIMFTLPDLQNPGTLLTQTRRYTNLQAYLDALPRRHYAMYAADNRFLGIRQESEMVKLTGIRVETWQPE